MVLRTIVEENLLAGESADQVTISGAGDPTNQGFSREFSVNVGETINFSCHSTNLNGTILDIYRFGYYGGARWHKVDTVTNTAVIQPAPTTIPNSNSGTTCEGWSITAEWNVPEDATSGLYIGVLRRNAPPDNASFIPFIVRNDDLEVDIIYKTSDMTWGIAYNNFGTMLALEGGKNFYGQNQAIGNITDRCFFQTYHKPIITRQGCPQTYWLACEAPLISFLERNGYNVKYVSCLDLDRDPSILNKGKIFISSGQDEYWSQNMRDNVEYWRDNSAGKSLFMSGNEVFWRTRFDSTRFGWWCYKDTMPGPGGHTAGTPLDPVTWTGTWKDTRWPGRQPEWLLTGTDFRMNGINDFDAVIAMNPYGGHTVWANSSLQNADIILTRVIGFEADDARPTQPVGSYRLLGTYTRSIGSNRADDNGQTYSNNGDINWGIVSQRYGGGGLTVGFGTCQWSWCLDSYHDRGTGTEVSLAAQQFTVNLLGDLGSQPGSLMSGITTRTPQLISNYGEIPVVEIDPTMVEYWDASSSRWKKAKVLGVGEGSSLVPLEVV